MAGITLFCLVGLVETIDLFFSIVNIFNFSENKKNIPVKNTPSKFVRKQLESYVDQKLPKHFNSNVVWKFWNLTGKVNKTLPIIIKTSNRILELYCRNNGYSNSPTHPWTAKYKITHQKIYKYYILYKHTHHACKIYEYL